MKWLVLLLLCSCTAREALSRIESQKADCVEFNKEFNRVGVTSPNWVINDKVSRCKELGAWDEPKK